MYLDGVALSSCCFLITTSREVSQEKRQPWLAASSLTPGLSQYVYMYIEYLECNPLKSNNTMYSNNITITTMR